MRYFTEIKEENSSNIASSYVIRKMLLEFSSLITVNENLYFTSSLEDYTIHITEGFIVLMPIPETD